MKLNKEHTDTFPGVTKGSVQMVRSVAKRYSDELSRCQVFLHLSSPGLVSLDIPLAHSSL